MRLYGYLYLNGSPRPPASLPVLRKSSSCCRRPGLASLTVVGHNVLYMMDLGGGEGGFFFGIKYEAKLSGAKNAPQ